MKLFVFFKKKRHVTNRKYSAPALLPWKNKMNKIANLQGKKALQKIASAKRTSS